MVQLKINFKKKDLFLVFAIGIFVIGIGYVMAYHSGASPAIFGHSAEELEVNIGGTTMTLQQAITNNLLGGGGSSNFDLSPSSGITPVMSYNYNYTATGTGKVIILAKGESPGVNPGDVIYTLKIDGTVVDTATSRVDAGVGGSRSFVLIGEPDLVSRQTYQITINAVDNFGWNEGFRYARILVQ